MEDLGDQIRRYAEDLTGFCTRYDLPIEWFEKIDHMAIKYSDGEHFDQGVEYFRSLSSEITCADIDNRRLAAAHLHMSIEIGSHGEVCWVEIMEPRPEKIGEDIVGFEHVEFYYPDFDAVRQVLDDYGITYQMQGNEGHSWINIVINEQGQELKINNGTLEDIVKAETAKGISRAI